MLKNLLCNLFFLGALANLPAQNWQPILLGTQHIFRHSDSTLISNVIKIDSSLAGIQFLNRVVADCDTCSQPAKLYNRGQFLQKTMQPHGNAGELIFAGNDTFLLKTWAEPGQTWLFNQKNQQQAKVVLKTPVFVGGLGLNPDSAKIIELTGGHRIILTKNYGLTRFPDFETPGKFYDLVGLPEKYIGENLPGVFDFFDFEVGDVFEFSCEGSWEPGTPSYIFEKEKKTVLQSFWDADTLIYKIDRRKSTCYLASGPPIKIFKHDTFLMKIHPAFFEKWVENGFPNQYVLSFPDQFNGFEASRVTFRNHPFFGKVKMVGEFSQAIQPLCGNFKTIEESGSEVLECDGCTAFHRAFSDGLGMVSEQIGCFEVWKMNALTGFIKMGDTTGVISPDDFFSKTNEPKTPQISVKISPNPTTDFWTLEFSEPLAEAANLVVFNGLGQKIYLKKLAAGDSRTQIPAVGLARGVYFLEVLGVKNFGKRKMSRS